MLIDDHALVLHGLVEILNSRGAEVVATANNGPEGIDRAKRHKPDIILLDIMMPQMNGIETLRGLRAAGIKVPVLMLTMSHDESHVASALREGANGYLLKDMDPDELLPALYDAVDGQNVVAKELMGTLTRIVQGKPEVTELPETPISSLTPRELEILQHLAKGQANKVIARDLGISDGTVKLHVKAILRKLKASSRVEAAVIAVQHGMGRSER
ncbi:MAG: response regulator [Gammaproteobacteria bacterium]|nr:response regulator [Gammaproteobacteria bacterium]